MTERKIKHLVVGMTGASGAPIGIELLQAMKNFPDWETHLVISEGARLTIEQETECTLEEVAAMATRCYRLGDVGARIASGTFKTQGMVIVPCSMKTLAGVATGYSDNLVLRAADVVIKERRKLVLVARESPLSPLHLQNMQKAADLGALILPPVLTFYNHPASIQDMTRHIVGKILDVFDLEMPNFKRWDGGDRQPPQ
ncbi:MAG: aromatic acid decarboxylase [Holophagaceae bacterium]|nr:aromatic acid decarboxylase [Holophagaceae bacterium]